MFCQHGVTIHGPIWHYLSEVGLFHYMIDEHISEYSSLEAFCISVCSSLHIGAYPFLRWHQTFHRLHSPFVLVVDPYELHTGAYPHSLGSFDLSQALVSFDLFIDPHELSYWSIFTPTEFSCIVILVFSDFRPHLPIIVLVSLSRDRTYIDRSFFHLVSLHFWDRNYIDRSFVCPFQFSLSQGRTYIDRPSSHHCPFQFE